MITWKGNEAYLGDKNLGRLAEDGSFVSNRNTNDHYFRLFKGWGFNKELIQDLIRKGVDRFKLIIDEGKRILVTNLSSIIAFGKSYQVEGYEPRWILAESSFDKVYEMKADGELGKFL